MVTSMVTTFLFASRYALDYDTLEKLCWCHLEKICLSDKREARENKALWLIPPLFLLWSLSWDDTNLRDVAADRKRRWLPSF